jgi:hypothetical protein
MFRQIASSLGKMTEIDWNSLFTSFFSMVRVKVARKDGSKIPRKSLFEMNNSLYQIQFKVEAVQGDGNLENGGGDDPGNDEKDGMEEFEHDPILDKEKPLGDRWHSAGSKQNQKQGSDSNQGFVGGQKLSSWASLFQREDVTMGMKIGGIDQYSCRKLLREKEAMDYDDEDKEMSLLQEDELVRLPDKLCEEIAKVSWIGKLLDNLYELPEMMDICQGKNEAKEDEVKKKPQKK